MRGRWIEVDRERLSRTLEQFEAIEQRAVTEGLSFGEAMRMLAGARIAADGAAGHADVDWSQTVAGPWLAEMLAALRRPDSAFIDPDISGEHSGLISKRGCSGFTYWPSLGSALALRTNDQVLEAKKQLAGDFLGGGAEMLLTEMKDA